MVIGQHGSWNRSKLSGYKVVFIPFAENGLPVGKVRATFFSGFLAPDEIGLLWPPRRRHAWAGSQITAGGR